MSEIIYGRNAVKEALENGRVEKIIALANHEFQTGRRKKDPL